MSFKYPPCQMNILTEKPFPRHVWEIIPNIRISISTEEGNVYFYKIICKNCKLNDPKPSYY